MSVDPSDGILAALGLKVINVIVGAISSFTALRFFDGLTVIDKWTTFVGGWALSAWGASPLAEYLGLGPKVEIGLVLLLGLFGMAIAAEFVRVVRALNWDTIRGIFGK